MLVDFDKHYYIYTIFRGREILHFELNDCNIIFGTLIVFSQDKYDNQQSVKMA